MDEETLTANPRRASIVPWRVGLLIDWAHQTQPMLDHANATELALEQAWQDGLIDRRVELVARKAVRRMPTHNPTSQWAPRQS